MSTRREFLQSSTAGIAAATALPSVLNAMESPAINLPTGQAEHCIMVWLGGGACQVDTWDPKRLGDAKTKKPGSYYPSIKTAISGVEVCEHLSKCAPILDRFNPIRSVHHDVIDEHAAATNRMHTGRRTSGTIVYPSIGSIIAHKRGAAGDGVPAYVLIGYPNVTRGPGFLGASAGYVYLTDTSQGPAGLSRPIGIDETRQQRRERLLETVRKANRRKSAGDRKVAGYDDAITEALRLSGPDFMKVFDLDREDSSLRTEYGGEFGQRCLLARRLIEAGTRFVEVSHNLNFVNGTGWDTHNDGQKKQHLLIQELDSALATLVLDLEKRKLLDKTLIVVNTEFGRPSKFDGGGGRGHQGKAFTVTLAGGGLKTGQAIGTTDELCTEIVDRPVSVPDLFATMCHAMQIDTREELYTSNNRPVPITDGGIPVTELFV